MTQAQALRVMESGRNVFLTGAPGAGKTYTLDKFIARSKKAKKRIAITASTGIAASHIGGTTIHSWSGLGVLDSLTIYDKRKLSSSDKLIKRYNSTDILVIDEISMLHGARLNMLDEMAKLLRQNDQPFGGIQVILVGDFFQLPPVSRDTASFDFVYDSAAWSELNLAICYLTEQHRQSENDRLLELLRAMRENRLDEEHREIVRSRLNLSVPLMDVTTRLYSHNIDVDKINQQELNRLPGELNTFFMQKDKGSKSNLEKLIKGLLVPEVLDLKTGAEVMFVANNPQQHYVNGSRGQIVGFNGGMPVVKLKQGREILVEPYTWTLTEDGKSRAEVSQLPLRLAWAITIHKSQGMSLDSAEVDLSRAFTPGMGYVALSRVRSLDGLYINGALSRMAFAMHDGLYELDNWLQISSSALADTIEDIEPADVSVPAEEALPVNEPLLKALKTWRTARARSDQVPPYIVAHDKTLAELASLPNLPKTTHDLLGVKGFGPKKIDTYGADIINVILGEW